MEDPVEISLEINEEENGSILIILEDIINNNLNYGDLYENFKSISIIVPREIQYKVKKYISIQVDDYLNNHLSIELFDKIVENIKKG